MKIGDRIRLRREELHMSADDLAKKIGKSRATVYRYENEDIKDLPSTILEPLSIALETSPDYIMGWTSESDEWVSSFCDNLSAELSFVDRAGVEAANINIDRLYSIAEGEVPISLSEACSIADGLGTSLDYLTGLNTSDERTMEFANMFAKLSEDEKDTIIKLMKGLLSNR